MYETLNEKDFQFLSDDDKDMLSRISAYSEKVIGDVDPQKMRISEQLEKLKPIMQEIADERGMALEDIFIKYMDLATLVNAKKDQKFKEDMQDLGVLEFKQKNKFLKGSFGYPPKLPFFLFKVLSGNFILQL